MTRSRTPAGPQAPVSLPAAAATLASVLARPGPHPVLRGELDAAGIPGVVFAPASGQGRPAVAFGHDWLQRPERYLPLLRHLASWGIVAAAPGSARGPLPDHDQFGADLLATAEVCASARLGTGTVSVDRGRLALAGHGMGGGCAVLAAAERPDAVAAVVTLAAAETRPSAVAAAPRVGAPGLHLAAGRDQVSPSAAGAEPLADHWGGPVVLRLLSKANHLGFLAGRSLVDALFAGSPQSATADLTRALVAAFLLHELAGERRVAELVHGELKGTELLLDR